MKIIAVIPARFEASRFPGKLMEKLGDKSVIATTYENVVATGLFSQVFVATDSSVIKQEIDSLGGHAVLTGPADTGSDRIAEATRDIECDIVLNVQGDEPFIERKPLEDLIEVFRQDQRREVSLASLKMLLQDEHEIRSPHNVKVVTDLKGNALYFSRSVVPYARESSVEVRYYKHIGVYAFRKQALQEFARLSASPLEIAEKIECLRYLENGMKIRMVETQFVGVGIDVPEDLEKAKAIMKNGLK